VEADMNSREIVETLIRVYENAINEGKTLSPEDVQAYAALLLARRAVT